MMIKLIKESSVFSRINSSELDKISKFSRLAEFKDGDQIFRAGDDAMFMYIVSKGVVKLKFSVIYLNAPTLLTMDTLKKQDCLGWSAFTKPYRYTLSAYAVGDTRLLQLQSENIRELCETNKKLGFIIMENITKMISARFARLQGLLQHVMQGYLK